MNYIYRYRWRPGTSYATYASRTSTRRELWVCPGTPILCNILLYQENTFYIGSICVYFTCHESYATYVYASKGTTSKRTTSILREQLLFRCVLRRRSLHLPGMLLFIRRVRVKHRGQRPELRPQRRPHPLPAGQELKLHIRYPPPPMTCMYPPPHTKCERWI